MGTQDPIFQFYTKKPNVSEPCAPNIEGRGFVKDLVYHYAIKHVNIDWHLPKRKLNSNNIYNRN